MLRIDASVAGCSKRDILNDCVFVLTLRKRVLLPFERKGSFVLMQGSHSVILKTTFGVKVIWDGDSYLEVIVSPAFKNNMCGLCGKTQLFSRQRSCNCHEVH